MYAPARALHATTCVHATVVSAKQVEPICLAGYPLFTEVIEHATASRTQEHVVVGLDHEVELRPGPFVDLPGGRRRDNSQRISDSCLSNGVDPCG